MRARKLVHNSIEKPCQVDTKCIQCLYADLYTYLNASTTLIIISLDLALLEYKKILEHKNYWNIKINWNGKMVYVICMYIYIISATYLKLN